jgi:hypothetical protein
MKSKLPAFKQDITHQKRQLFLHTKKTQTNKTPIHEKSLEGPRELFLKGVLYVIFGHPVFEQKYMNTIFGSFLGLQINIINFKILTYCLN